MAPAKINWTLEVLGRRPDGFHEVKTILQTIDLCDSLELESAPELTLAATGEGLPPPQDNLAMRAARLLKESTGYSGGARMRLTKVMPVAAGLGGGSSDAAAALRGLDRLWGLALPHERLVELAADVGSDVPFFLRGGTALAEGRGERITPLPDASGTAILVVVPPLAMPHKTQRMYSLLGSRDYSDGAASDRFADALRQGRPFEEGDLHNAFDFGAFRAFPELQACRQALIQAGAEAVHLAGSGPALFVLLRDEEQRERLARAAASAGAKAFAATTIPSSQALATEQLPD
ncbi:MAG: 4-(cytidine 5'-diphospho)-2-C-methyl-D-erythritol kinase [Dehalococcoidia bacterium]|nr:4-(cytidine 5'-diphospho)-2-C-methyl-D-erythritol kinase [Dehalococcoidia bacterium]